MDFEHRNARGAQGPHAQSIYPNKPRVCCEWHRWSPKAAQAGHFQQGFADMNMSNTHISAARAALRMVARAVAEALKQADASSNTSSSGWTPHRNAAAARPDLSLWLVSPDSEGWRPPSETFAVICCRAAQSGSPGRAALATSSTLIITLLLLLLQSLTPAHRAVPQASPGRAALAASPQWMWWTS